MPGPTSPVSATVGAVLLTVAAAACSRGPALPEEMTFEGERLEKATSWSSQGVSGVVFVPPGERMPSASLQVGVLASRMHASGAGLHRWIMDQYHRSPTTQWHESATADEACKIGLTDAGVPRPFLALHVCRGGDGVAACAEVDERLDDNEVGRCLTSTAGCWEELCTLRWRPAREELEPILEGVLNH